jgi:ubiquinone/menaquinone biosynthesis C-methylase UbiE
MGHGGGSGGRPAPLQTEERVGEIMPQTSDQNERVLDQFTRQAEGYARLVAQPAGAPPSPALALMAPQPDDLALDVACGSGNLTFELAAVVRHVTGVDLTPAMIDQARAAQAARGFGNVDWRVADIQDLPFGDAAFSLVACRAAVHHFADPRAVLAEMARVCRPGGRIAVVDFAFAEGKTEAFDTAERKRDPSHVHAHTLDELRALADGTALSEVLAQPLGARELPFDAVLATSFPDDYSRDEIRALFHADAVGGEDRLGLSARLVEGELTVSYPQGIVVWRKG